MDSFRALCYSCLIALAPLWAEEPSAPVLLEAGAYHCATVTTDGGLDLVTLTIERAGDVVRANMSDQGTQLTGRLIGQRLYLFRHDFSDVGLEIVQVFGSVLTDGSVQGNAVRTLDGLVIERGVFTLRRLP